MAMATAVKHEDLVAPLLRDEHTRHDSVTAAAFHDALESISPVAAGAIHDATHAVSRFFESTQYSVAAGQRRRFRRVQRLRSRVHTFHSSESDAKSTVLPPTQRYTHGCSFSSGLSDDEQHGNCSSVVSGSSHFSFGSSDECSTESTESKGDVDEYASTDEETPIPSGAKAKAAGVGLVTVLGLSSYLASFVGTAAVFWVPASPAAVAMLGAAGGVLILIVPWIWLSEWRLIHMQALRMRLNELRREANRFNQHVQMLRMEEEELKKDTEILRKNNVILEKRIGGRNSENIHELVAQVQENQQILRQMKENLRQVVLQDVVRLILRSDLNHDNTINKHEADILAMRLTLTLSVYGIVFDVDKFHRAVGLSPSLGGVMTIVRRLIPDKKGKLSSFYDSIVSSAEGDDSFDESLWDKGDDVYDMFHVPMVETDEDFHGKCTFQSCKEYLLKKGAQGKLMSLAQSVITGQCPFNSSDEL